jgi:tRNA U38,U39,U40 pseudouridine synthase TruA
LSWKKPKHINGELEKYEIEIRKLQIIKDLLKQRNFCEQRTYKLKIENKSL